MARLRKLKNSPLRPERIWIESFEFASRPDAAKRTGPVGVKADLEVELADDGRSFVLRLFLASSAAKGDGSPYDFKSESVARFALDDSVEGEEAGRLISVNAAAVLYGAVRGFIATATALGAHGPLFLPTVNLVDTFFDAWKRYAAETGLDPESGESGSVDSPP